MPLNKAKKRKLQYNTEHYHRCHCQKIRPKVHQSTIFESSTILPSVSIYILELRRTTATARSTHHVEEGAVATSSSKQHLESRPA